MGRTKMKKYLCMTGSKEVAPHVPETRWMTRSNFWDLVAKYRQVILKPLGGSRGSGVIQVSEKGYGYYQVHRENKWITIQGQEETYRFLKREMGGRTYIVQHRIPLATVDNRPFDMRLIVQRKRKSRAWKVTGKAAKVAGEGYIVTNISRSNGTVLPVETAIERSSLEDFSPQMLISDIEKVAIQTAKRLARIYPHQRIYGMDIGLDDNGHVWVIEANRKPMLSHILMVEDERMYRRIQRYKRG